MSYKNNRFSYTYCVNTRTRIHKDIRATLYVHVHVRVFDLYTQARGQVRRQAGKDEWTHEYTQ